MAKRTKRRDLSSLTSMMDAVEETSQLDTMAPQDEAEPLQVVPVVAESSIEPQRSPSTPAEPEEEPATPSAPPTQTAERDQPAQRGSKTSASAKKKSADKEAEQQARNERDQAFAVALQEQYGLDPSDFAAPPGRTKGSTFRPTIELSPQERAGITAANTMRPDLFDTTMAGFVRHFALHWQEYVRAASNGDR